MTTPYLGEIRMFCGTFAPVGWELCNGQLLNVTENEALFSVIGTIYGGDGRTTFGLPDMRGRIPVGEGQGPGLTTRSMGQKGGTNSESLTVSEIPSHTHVLNGTTDNTTSSSGDGTVLAANSTLKPYRPDDPNTTLAPDAISNSGGSGTAHTNLMPYQVLNYIIATIGLIPTQT